MASDIKVLSWNIHGLKAKLEEPERKTKLLEIFDRYDIVLLQETKIGPMNGGKDDDRDWNIITEALSEEYALVKLEEEEEVEEREKKTMYMTYFSSNNKGVAILINRPHTLLQGFCEGGDYAWVHVEIDGQEFTFVSVYYRARGPNLMCNLMLKIIYSLTVVSDAFRHRPVIGGDFNTTLDPNLDANNEIKGHAARRERLNEFLRIYKLSDVWRRKHSRARNYTHTHYNGTKSILDYIFMLENDVEHVKSCNIGLFRDNNVLNERTLSDHSPVSLTLNSGDIEQRREE